MLQLNRSEWEPCGQLAAILVICFCCCRSFFLLSFAAAVCLWLCDAVFTLPLPLPLFPPLSWPLVFSTLSGDGDEEHAVLSHGICQEWGDFWWVFFFLNAVSVLLQHLMHFALPCLFFISYPYQGYRNSPFYTNKGASWIPCPWQ